MPATNPPISPEETLKLQRLLDDIGTDVKSDVKADAERLGPSVDGEINGIMSALKGAVAVGLVRLGVPEAVAVKRAAQLIVIGSVAAAAGLSAGADQLIPKLGGAMIDAVPRIAQGTVSHFQKADLRLADATIIGQGVRAHLAMSNQTRNLLLNGDPEAASAAIHQQLADAGELSPPASDPGVDYRPETDMEARLFDACRQGAISGLWGARSTDAASSEPGRNSLSAMPHINWSSQKALWALAPEANQVCTPGQQWDDTSGASADEAPESAVPAPSMKRTGFGFGGSGE